MGKNAVAYSGFANEAAGIPPSYNDVNVGSAYESKTPPSTAAFGSTPSANRAVRQEKQRFGTAAYLTFYNWLATAAWGYVLFLIVGYLLRTRGLPRDPAALYKHVMISLNIAQSMQIAEILHAALGLVRSSPLVTFTQVFSRIQLVLFLFRLSSRAYTSVGVIALLLAWSLAELIRYPYFGVQELLQLLNARTKRRVAARTGITSTGAAEDEKSAPPAPATSLIEVPAILKWLRYSGFIVLYPVGIAGEVLCMLAALPELKKYAHFPTPMPNYLNFEVNLYYCYVGLLAAYIPGSVLLYSHMLQQRKKSLYGQPSDAESRKKRQ